MIVRWNGHSSFTITAADGTVIVMDPYEPGSFGGGITYYPVDVAPDVVTISHDHADHNYTAGFKGKFTTLRQDGKAKGISFRTVKTYHDDKKGALRGENNVFVFTVDGITVCHLGDLGHVLTDKQIKEIGKIDLLFVPVGGYYTIDPLQATDAVERLDPRVVIPMHFKTEKCKFPIVTVDEFLKGKLNAKMIDADAVELTAGKLPGAREILVLKHHY